jgi:hypothetical protein
MLQFINIVQALVALALLFLLGQGVLYLLAGASRDNNFVYRMFQVLTKPWLKAARFIAPRQVGDHQLGYVAFFLLAAIYLIVLVIKIDHCMSINMVGCK